MAYYSLELISLRPKSFGKEWALSAWAMLTWRWFSWRKANTWVNRWSPCSAAGFARSTPLLSAF